MAFLTELINNHSLIVACVAWVLAQGLKVIVEVIKHKRLDFSRLIGSGGMPSSHTAFVVSLAVAIGRQSGFDSAVFAVAAGFAIVVMSDAAGVRRAAGKQAAVLNRIVKDMMENGKPFDHVALRELLGHTPVQVMAGALLGLAVALIM